VFTESDIIVATTESNLAEVREYLPRLASKYALELEILEAQLKILPLEIHDDTSYADCLAEARQQLELIDPDDIHLLALALKLGIPIWSNDKHFETVAVKVYPTASLLKNLGI
jgi:predicted nucleic acid-binding protein